MQWKGDEMSDSQSLVSHRSLHLGRKGGPPPPLRSKTQLRRTRLECPREKDRERGIRRLLLSIGVPLSSWTRGWVECDDVVP